MRTIKFSRATVTHSNPFMEIRHTHAEFGAFSKDYYVIHFGPRVGVVVLHQGKLLLARQYRFLVNDTSWEIPGGKVEPSETPETAGLRECLEETGVRCRNLRRLVAYYPGLDNVENRTTLLYTDEAEIPATFVSNAAEVEEIAWIDFGECLEMVYAGRILDALTVVGILSYAVQSGAKRRL